MKSLWNNVEQVEALKEKWDNNSIDDLEQLWGYFSNDLNALSSIMDIESDAVKAVFRLFLDNDVDADKRMAMLCSAIFNIESEDKFDKIEACICKGISVLSPEDCVRMLISVHDMEYNAHKISSEAMDILLEKIVESPASPRFLAKLLIENQLMVNILTPKEIERVFHALLEYDQSENSVQEVFRNVAIDSGIRKYVVDFAKNDMTAIAAAKDPNKSMDISNALTRRYLGHTKMSKSFFSLFDPDVYLLRSDGDSILSHVAKISNSPEEIEIALGLAEKLYSNANYSESEKLLSDIVSDENRADIALRQIEKMGTLSKTVYDYAVSLILERGNPDTIVRLLDFAPFPLSENEKRKGIMSILKHDTPSFKSMFYALGLVAEMKDDINLWIATFEKGLTLAPFNRVSVENWCVYGMSSLQSGGIVTEEGMRKIQYPNVKKALEHMLYIVLSGVSENRQENGEFDKKTCGRLVNMMPVLVAMNPVEAKLIMDEIGNSLYGMFQRGTLDPSSEGMNSPAWVISSALSRFAAPENRIKHNMENKITHSIIDCALKSWNCLIDMDGEGKFLLPSARNLVKFLPLPYAKTVFEEFSSRCNGENDGTSLYLDLFDDTMSRSNALDGKAIALLPLALSNALDEAIDYEGDISEDPANLAKGVVGCFLHQWFQFDNGVVESLVNLLNVLPDGSGFEKIDERSASSFLYSMNNFLKEGKLDALPIFEAPCWEKMAQTEDLRNIISEIKAGFCTIER